MNKKILVAIFVVVILIISAVFSLIIMSGKGKNSDGDFSQEQQVTEDLKSKKEELEIETEDGQIVISKNYNFVGDKVVYRFLNAKATQIEDDETYEYTYEIPQFNLESDNTKKINMEILDKYQVNVEDYIKENKEINPKYEAIQYAYYENGSIISLILVVKAKDDNFSEFYTYNVDKSTGENVLNSKLLFSASITENEVMQKINSNIENSSEYQNLPDDFNIEFVKQQILKTKLKYEDADIEDIDLYLNDDCELMACIYLCPAQGGKAIPTMFNLSKDVKIAEANKPIQTEEELMAKINEILVLLQANTDLGPYAQLARCYYYKNNDVLSIIVQCPTESETTYDYYTYNVALSTGKTLSNSDLIKKISVSEDEIRSKLENAIKEIEMYKEDSELAKELCQKTIDMYSDIKIKELNIYLNGYGNITIPLEVYNTVGEEMRTLVIDIERGEAIDKVE